MTANERRLRLDLACALRWCARLGWHEAVANHFSVAVSDDGAQFLMNPGGRHFSRIRPNDLLMMDARANAPDTRADPTAQCLHGYFHRHLPQARCLLHTHMPYATALASLKNWRVLPIDQNACRFYNRVAYDETFGGMLLAQEEAARQAALLGGRKVLLMRSHGVLAVGNTVGDAFDTLYYFEQTCRNQWLALATGQPLCEIAPAVAEKTAQQWEEYPNEAHFEELKNILRDEKSDVFDGV